MVAGVAGPTAAGVCDTTHPHPGRSAESLDPELISFSRAALSDPLLLFRSQASKIPLVSGDRGFKHRSLRGTFREII